MRVVGLICRACILEIIRHYTGQLREGWEPFRDIPRSSSLVTVDGHIYVRVDTEKRT